MKKIENRTLAHVRERRKSLSGKSLFGKFPELCKEWDYKKNYPLTPKDVSCYTDYKVGWKCKSGHEWVASISHRSNFFY